MLRLLSLCLVTCLVAMCHAQCDILEGTTISVSCNLNQPGNFTELQWMLYSYRDSSRTILSTCTPSGSCTNNYPQIVTANLTNYKSFLTITKLSRSVPIDLNYVYLECQWIPVSLNNIVCYSINVVALPPSLPCEVVTVNDTTRFVNCTIGRSFPYSYCYSEVSRDNVSFTPSNNGIGSQLVPTNETPVYYSGSCQVNLDLFFIGTTYLRVIEYFSRSSFIVYSETFVFKTVLDDGTTTQTSIATTPTAESPRVTVEAVGASPTSGVVLGLAVATGVCALVAIVLAIVLIVLYLRNKKNNQQQQQHVPPKAPVSPTPVVIPGGYNRVTPPVHEPGDDPENFYEEVGRSKPAPAGANPQATNNPEVYLNSPSVNDPNKTTRDQKTKRLQHAPDAPSLSPPEKNQGGVSFRGLEEQSSEAQEEVSFRGLEEQSSEAQEEVSFRGLEEQSSEAQEEDVYVNATDLKLQNAT